MKNEITWKKSQKFGGISFVVSGICIIAAGLLTEGTMCMVWSLGILAADVIIDIIYTRIAACKYS